MGLRIDCSNPVREFYLTPIVECGRITGWQGKIITGRWYTVSVDVTPDVSMDTPRLKCRIQRDPTISEAFEASEARTTRQLTLEDIQPDLYASAIDIVRHRLPVCTQTIQRRLHITYHQAQGIIDHLQVDGYIGPPRNDSKYRDVLKAS